MSLELTSRRPGEIGQERVKWREGKEDNMHRCSQMGPYHRHSVSSPLSVRLHLHGGESIIIGARVILAGNNCSVWKANVQFLIKEFNVKASETNFDLKAYPVSNNCGKEKCVIVRLPVV